MDAVPQTIQGGYDMNVWCRMRSATVILVVMILLAGCEPTNVPNATKVLQLDGTPGELCVDDSLKRSREGDTVKLSCDLRLIDLQFLAPDTPPGTTFAKVKCSCKDNPSGSFACSTCTCQEDADSDCKSFLTWCTDTGGEALGGGDIGICNKP